MHWCSWLIWAEGFGQHWLRFVVKTGSKPIRIPKQAKRLDAGDNKAIWQHVFFAANLRFFQICPLFVLNLFFWRCHHFDSKTIKKHMPFLEQHRIVSYPFQLQATPTAWSDWRGESSRLLHVSSYSVKSNCLMLFLASSFHGTLKWEQAPWMIKKRTKLRSLVVSLWLEYPLAQYMPHGESSLGQLSRKSRAKISGSKWAKWGDRVAASVLARCRRGNNTPRIFGLLLFTSLHHLGWGQKTQLAFAW